ncbi:MAG: hypothetical protein IJV40_04590, partial [Oscillospiraceae bacterium]|nr:hypothetical protein [Oscillospiraceae bacterium]
LQSCSKMIIHADEIAVNQSGAPPFFSNIILHGNCEEFKMKIDLDRFYNRQRSCVMKKKAGESYSFQIRNNN